MTIMDKDGNELKSGNVMNSRHEVEAFLNGKGDEIKAVIEAGRSNYVMVDLLKEFGVDIRIAHPSEVKAIARAKIKTDKRDSRILAHLLRTDLIPEVYARSEENRRGQRVLRHRAFFVGSMTRVKNKIRVLIAQQKMELQEEASRVRNIFSQKGLVSLMGLNLPSPDDDLMESLLKMYRNLEERIKESTGLVKELYSRLRESQLISTVPGFGEFFSVLTATEIAEVKRFKSLEKLHSYVGVIPSTYSSGEKSYHGKIIKGGNAWLRWAAVEAVYPACRKDFDIWRFFDKRARRKGVNVAKVATARYLLTIIYRVLKDGRAYIPYKR
jgi:transposase